MYSTKELAKILGLEPATVRNFWIKRFKEAGIEPIQKGPMYLWPAEQVEKCKKLRGIS